jgi:hypothetical protein
MKTKAWMIAALWAGIAACSSASGGGGQNGLSSVTPGSASGGAGSGSASSSGGVSASSGGSLSGDSTGSASGVSGGGSGVASTSGTTDVEDAGPPPGLIYDSSVPDADLDAPVTLTMTPFTVQPNTEVYECQWFGNPFGKDVDIVKLVSHMSEGSHHFFVFNMSPLTKQTTAAPLKACPQGGLEFYPFPLLSQQPDWTVTYPQSNMGYPFLATNGFMLNAHFLNSGSTPITPVVTVTIYPAKAGVVTVPVGSIFLNNIYINVPANTTTPVAVTDSDVPITDEDYTIFTHWSHMHKFATDFQTSVAGNVVYDEKNWDEPELVTQNSPLDTYHSLPLAVKSGTKISWQCSYTNPTSSAMSFGESANTADMCIYMGQYYPADGTPGKTSSYPDIIVGYNL